MKGMRHCSRQNLSLLMSIVISQLESKPKKLFEFPDGYHKEFGIERLKMSELFFQPKLVLDQVKFEQALMYTLYL